MAKKGKSSPAVYRGHIQSAPDAAPASSAPGEYVSPLARTALPAVSWYEIVATGFFSGYLPKAPGTWGSLFAILIFFLTARLLPNEGLFKIGFFSVSWYAIVLGVFSTILGIVSSGMLADEWKSDDPGEIVIDEFAGIFFACAFITPTPVGLAAAFVLFRIFDIAKPGPIKTIQDLPGGRGIVLDDVLAGIAAAPLAFGAQLLFNKVIP